MPHTKQECTMTKEKNVIVYYNVASEPKIDAFLLMQVAHFRP